MAIDVSVNPFFDDYNQDKKFAKILYRPGYAVQARELNQTQTLLQKQIERLGSHFFKNGSIVIPGGFDVNVTLQYAKINYITSFDEINIAELIGSPVTNSTGALTGTVVDAIATEGTDPTTIYIRYDAPTSGTNLSYRKNELLTITTTTLGAVDVQILNDNSAVGTGTAVTLKRGVYFANGYFVATDDDDVLIVDKYSSNASAKIGFLYTESVISEDEDTSLYDNAVGSPNFTAPGAHRLKVELVPTSIGLEDTDEDFIEFARIETGIITKSFDDPQYNEIEKLFAKRTSDESGDYIIDPFDIKITDHPTDSDKVRIELDPGRGYVKGFEVETISPTFLDADRARTTDSLNNSYTALPLGNYIEAIVDPSTTGSLPSIEDYPTIFFETATVGSNFAEARIRLITFNRIIEDHFGAGLDAHVYRLYLTNYSTSGVAPLTPIKIRQYDPSVTDPIVSDVPTCTIPEIVQSTFSPIFNETKDVVSVFELPFDSVSGLTDIIYQVYKEQTVVAVAGVLTVGTSSNEPFLQDVTKVTLVNLATGVSYQPTVSIITFPSANSMEIDLTGTGYVGGDSFKITSAHQVLTSTPKTKTLAAGGSILDVGSVGAPGTPSTIIDVDVVELTRVVELVLDNINGTIPVGPDLYSEGPEVTDRYILDGGQRDNFYLLGALYLREGFPVPDVPILVEYDFFQHGPGDYITVDSYVNVDPADIPSYTAKNGTVYDLQDCVDFRPAVANTFNNFESLSRQFVPNSAFISDISYYLGRKDRLVVSASGDFAIVSGAADVQPKFPDEPQDVLTLYKLTYPAYTDRPSDIFIEYVDNRRYTMKDIGRIDKRLSAVEYVVSLNLLEKRTADLKIVDSGGFDLFKSGFIADNFETLLVSDASNVEFTAAVDTTNKLLRPRANERFVNYGASSVPSSLRMHDNGLVTMNYTETVAVQQPLASNSIPVFAPNPDDVDSNLNTPYFYPITVVSADDQWYDSENITIINNESAEETRASEVVSGPTGNLGISLTTKSYVNRVSSDPVRSPVHYNLPLRLGRTREAGDDSTNFLRNINEAGTVERTLFDQTIAYDNNDPQVNTASFRSGGLMPGGLSKQVATLTLGEYPGGEYSVYANETRVPIRAGVDYSTFDAYVDAAESSFSFANYKVSVTDRTDLTLTVSLRGVVPAYQSGRSRAVVVLRVVPVRPEDATNAADSQTVNVDILEQNCVAKTTLQSGWSRPIRFEGSDVAAVDIVGSYSETPYPAIEAGKNGQTLEFGKFTATGKAALTKTYSATNNRTFPYSASVDFKSNGGAIRIVVTEIDGSSTNQLYDNVVNTGGSSTTLVFSQSVVNSILEISILPLDTAPWSYTGTFSG